MNRRLFLIVVGSALWLAHATPSTPQDKIPRIGFLTQCMASFDEQGFKQGLSELGYVEGKTILIEWRRVDLAIDLHVAHQMGIKVPQELLYRADEVIR